MSAPRPGPAGRITTPSLVVSVWRGAPPVLRRLALWLWVVAFAVLVASLSIDLEQINRAAWAMHGVVDIRASELFFRQIELVRDHGNLLLAALASGPIFGDTADDRRQLIELLSNLQAVVLNHRQLMTVGEQHFGRRPALARPDRSGARDLRNKAVDFVRSVTRIHDACIELHEFTRGPGLGA
jgi:hypothetical protein